MARNTGYGAPTRRAAAASSVAARRRPMRTSSSLMFNAPTVILADRECGRTEVLPHSGGLGLDHDV